MKSLNAARAERDFQQEIKIQNEKIRELIAVRKVRGAAEKADLERSYGVLAAEGPESLAAGMAQLSEAIADLDALIQHEKNTRDEQVRHFDEALASLAPVAVDQVKQVRKQLDVFFRHVDEFINETIEFYYFLLALRADYDPEAREGASFGNPDALGEFLRDQLKA